ncbi:hypothetical protein OFL98_28480, partial [Escherichia coli]|nr:hypothetical protein [Escherichia coli]
SLLLTGHPEPKKVKKLKKLKKPIYDAFLQVVESLDIVPTYPSDGKLEIYTYMTEVSVSPAMF